MKAIELNGTHLGKVLVVQVSPALLISAPLEEMFNAVRDAVDPNDPFAVIKEKIVFVRFAGVVPAYDPNGRNYIESFRHIEQFFPLAPDLHVEVDE